jgi:hypothetical protein
VHFDGVKEMSAVIESNIEDFIGTFDNAVSSEQCQRIIEYFEKLSAFHKVRSRSEITGQPAIQQDNSVYCFMVENEESFIQTNQQVLNEFNMSLQECYKQYAKKYGVLNEIARHRINFDIKLQKTAPGEGYHVWHCEHSSVATGKRLFLVILYLNEVEGGETEFLYLHKRIQPKTGRLLICPSGFSHTHRGNPPLKGCKYILNGWIEFIE